MTREIATMSPISPDDMTGEQLARPESEPRYAQTQYGRVQGGTTRNGAAVFLNVPYAEPVPRWTPVKPLPSSYRYSEEPYIRDSNYCAQPTRYYTAQIPVRQRLGLGKPTETPFFADIYVPSTVDLNADDLPRPVLPVKVFLHGGFINFGSTSGSHYNQQTFAAEAFGEIRVLLGHRISVWGFLASEKHGIEGNYGFKDCWAGLEWVRDNISAFGGDPTQIHLSGLSGGSHIVHQLLHYAARQAPAKAPFVSAFLQSNAILSNPVPASAKESQLNALLKGLSIDESDPDALRRLREEVSMEQIVDAVQNMGFESIFRGVAGKDGWNAPDEMEFQHSGELGRRLLTAGVQFVVMGDVKDENAFYSIVHPCQSKDDMIKNLCRFYPISDAERLYKAYFKVMPSETMRQCDELQGQIFADGQVHLSCRLLARDLIKGGMPSVRYAVEWVPKALGSKGVVSHGSDLSLHHFRLSMLSPDEARCALEFRDALDAAVEAAIRDPKAIPHANESQMLLMRKDGVTQWASDWRWPQLRLAEAALGLQQQ